MFVSFVPKKEISKPNLFSLFLTLRNRGEENTKNCTLKWLRNEQNLKILSNEAQLLF